MNYMLKINTGLRDDVRMKRTDLPEENEQSVYTRMISERESKAQEYFSRGDAEKNKIIAETDKTVQELLSTAAADAETIRGEGEAEGAQVYNQSYSKRAEFYSLSVRWNLIKRPLMEKRSLFFRLTLHTLVANGI